jgi:hypothetical protein
MRTTVVSDALAVLTLSWEFVDDRSTSNGEEP